MRIDIWSDIICPFCMIGKVELAAALAAFPHRGQVQIALRSYELNPGMQGRHGTVLDHVRTKYGMTPQQAADNVRQVAERARSVGLAYNWEQAPDCGTHDAHRLVKAAVDAGCGPQVEAALMTASFTGGRDVSDHGVLTELAVGAGLDADRAAAVLGSDEYSAQVAEDQSTAASLGIAGVPFFLFDGTYGVSGAQSAATFAQALAQVWELTAAASPDA